MTFFIISSNVFFKNLSYLKPIYLHLFCLINVNYVSFFKTKSKLASFMN